MKRERGQKGNGYYSAASIAYGLQVSHNAVLRWAKKKYVRSMKDGKSWDISLSDCIRHILDTPVRHRVNDVTIEAAQKLRDEHGW